MSLESSVGENVGKVVGRRSAGDPLSTASSGKKAAAKWKESLGTSFVPRGVYRFRSHEEADAWMWKMISRPKKA